MRKHRQGPLYVQPLLHPTLDKLAALKLPGMQHALIDQMALSDCDDLGFDERFGIPWTPSAPSATTASRQQSSTPPSLGITGRFPSE